MVPPEMKDGRFPVILYNFGGVIMNLLSSAVFLGLYFLLKVFFPSLYLLWLLWLFFAVMGILLAVTNGIPLRVGMVDNDGRNALSLANDPEARRAFWIQLKMNEQITAGRRLREMPEQWFAFPTEEKTQENSMTAATAVFSCNRLMDEMRFAEADARMARLLASGDGMVGLHRNGLLCDRIYCLLLAGKREEASRLTTPALRKFLRAMKENPSALRTEYVLALLLEGDKEKAAMLRLRFAKAIEKHPYAGEALSEKELIAAAEAVGFPEKATV